MPDREKPIRSTKAQRDLLRASRLGTGIVIYNSGPSETSEFIFYHDRKGVMRDPVSNKEIEFPLDVAYDVARGDADNE